jgi:ABC-type Fe3+/spermidine/putrescine transport system ATPase subunit
MGMVFQNYALFPHMSVADNVAYGLRARRLPTDEITRRVADVLKMIRLDGYGSRRSGSFREDSSNAWRSRARWSSSPTFF